MNSELSAIGQAPNFYTINSVAFSRDSNGVLLFNQIPVTINQTIVVDTSGTGAAAAWTRTAQNGDMFFVYCKRGVGCSWTEHHLPVTLATRGIYAITKSISGPYNYSPGRMAIDVRVVDLLGDPVPQWEINGNPLTYWATPYRGNRNDAIQRHPDDANQALAPHPQQGLEFVKMIVARNPNLRNTIINEWPWFKGRI